MEYDKEVLRKLQLTQVEILKDIDKFCKDNNIEYIIAYGTLLGAMRHGGFIPWDDDIDICMRREEYDRFVELAKEKMSDKYDLLNIYDTAGYISTFAKVSKKGTKFVEATNSNPNYQQGIFVDVFPLDYPAEDEKARKKVFKNVWFWARVCMLCEIADPIIPQGITGIKRSIVKFGCKFVHGFFKLFRFNKIKAYKKYLKNATKYNDNKNAKYVSDFCDIKPERDTYLISDIFPAKPIMFEDYEFQGPANPDVMLRTYYGDYMELPPVEKRHNHMAKELVFGDEKGN